MNDPFAPFFQSFSQILGGGGAFQHQPDPRNTGPMPPFNPATFHQQFQQGPSLRRDGSAPSSPLQEGRARQAFGNGNVAMPGTPHLTQRDANNPHPNAFPLDNLKG